jgi:hypothetical protein
MKVNDNVSFDEKNGTLVVTGWITAYKRVRVDGRNQQIADGTRKIELTIDTGSIMHSVGGKAASNRTGKSVLGSGMIKAKRLG